MRSVLATVTIFMVSQMALSQCLSKSDYALFNLTALDAVVANSTANVCQNAFKSGQCVTADSITAIFKQTKEQMTKSALGKLDKIVGAVQKSAQRFQKAVDNANRFKNGTLPSANNTSSGNSTNKKKNAVDKKLLKLEDRVVKTMQSLQTKLNDQKKFLTPITNKDERKKCFRAQFRLLGATICGISSGNATNLVTRNANGVITAIAVSSNATNNVISECGQLLITNCDMSSLQQSLVESLGTAANVTAPAIPTYCADMTALNNCVSNPANCADALKTTIFSNSFAPLKDLLFQDVNTSNIESTTTVFADTLDVEDSTTRRLQSAASNIGYVVSSNGISESAVGANTNLSDEDVESSVTVPASLNSAFALQAFSAFLAAIALSLFA